MRFELDNGTMLELNTDENTIKFNKTGIFKVAFFAIAYVKASDNGFDPSSDFVEIAFREVGTDNIFAATNTWTPNECASNVFGQGMFVINDISKKYKLVNVQRKSIYLNGSNIGQTISHSYFSAPMVSLTII